MNKIRETNNERYRKGIKKVVEEFNLDFAGNSKHGELLGEIEELAANFWDPENPAVIHPNAVYLATQEVLREKGIQAAPARKPNQEAKRAKQEADQTVADKLFQRNKERYEREMRWKKDPQRPSSD